MMQNCLHVIMPAPNFANSHTPRIYLGGIDKKKLCSLCQAESDWDWVTDTLRKQSTCAPCSELDQLEVTSQTRVFRIVENDLKFGAVIL